MYEQNNVTHCLTIGRRPDLLKQTLESLAGLPSMRTIAINDFGDEETNVAFRQLVPDGKLLLNKQQIGHHPAVDQLYSAVSTDFIFHNEDDWKFSRTDFIEQSIRLLEADPMITAVVIRDAADIGDVQYLHHKFRHDELDGIKFLRLDHLHEQWHGFTFNPHVIRRSTWEKLGGYSSFKKERHISRYLKSKGHFVAFLTPGACTHIGGGRSNVEPNVSLLRRTKRRLKSLWRKSIHRMRSH